MASYLQHASDRLDVGEAVSGPAAPRLMNAARDAATRYEGMFLSPRQARALLADPALRVHDNPRAFLACNYDPAKALCHPGRSAGKNAGHPDLDRCNPACANIARIMRRAHRRPDRRDCPAARRSRQPAGPRVHPPAAHPARCCAGAGR
jgi:hypothetical protein